MQRMFLRVMFFAAELFAGEPDRRQLSVARRGKGRTADIFRGVSRLNGYDVSF